MHPAYEGLSAMPFYDEFDLSTVDVLLISQYVYARFASQLQYIGGGNLAHHCSRTVCADSAASQTSPCISESMEYYLHSTSPTPVMCLPSPCIQQFVGVAHRFSRILLKLETDFP
jgi:hypothetical protein